MSKVFFSPGDNEVGIGTTDPQQNFTISLSAFGVTTGLNTVSGQAQAGTWTNHPYVIMVNSAEVARFATTGFAVTGTSTATGALVSSGTNLVNAAAKVVLSYEGSSASYLQAYGANSVTAGTLSIRTQSSDASVSAIPAIFSTTGLAVTGTLSATGGINSTAIGAITPSTGAFTTVSATGGINSTAIGAITPSTGAFTTVSATGQSVFPGFVTNKTTASSGRIWVQDAGANSYNEIQSRNYANTADLSLNITSSIGVNINGPLSITVGGILVAQFTSVGLTNTASPLLSLSSFKSVVAASTDFADFKTRVAAL